MEFEDPIHGTQTVENDVIKQLIKSEPVQRLKEVHQAGPSPFFMEDKPHTTRFEHSLGVFFLLRDFDASIEEQIAGLLHDVPHTAFSHVADFVFEEEDHEYHERFMEEIIYNSKISDILENHGFDVDYILDESNFGLLEKDLPKLCADRLDYSMRDLNAHKGYEMQKFRSNLTVKDGEFIFKDFETAEEYGMKFIEADNSFWAHPKEVAIYEIFAEAIRQALKNGEINEKDLFLTDTEFLEKLRKSKDSEVQDRLELLDNGLEINLGEEDYDILGNTKARAVDPPFLEEGEKVQASEKSEKLENAIEEHNNKVNKGFKITVVN